MIIAGLLVAPTAIGALLSGTLHRSVRRRNHLVTGATVLAVVTVPFLFLTPTTYWLLCIVMIVRVIGFGLSIIPTMTAVRSSPEPCDRSPERLSSSRSWTAWRAGSTPW